jgi:hypothetical protein
MVFQLIDGIYLLFQKKDRKGGINKIRSEINLNQVDVENKYLGAYTCYSTQGSIQRKVITPIAVVTGTMVLIVGRSTST